MTQTSSAPSARASSARDVVHAHWLPSVVPAMATGKPVVLQLWGSDAALATRARPLAHDDEGEPLGGLGELAHALLLGQATDEEDVRRLVGLAHGVRSPHALRDDANVPRPERACIVREGRRGADHDPRAAHEPPCKRPGPRRKRRVGAPGLEHDRLPRRQRGNHARKPVCVDDVSRACGTTRSARKREEEERERERLPRRGAQVVDDAVPVGDPVVAEARRRDDAHLGPGGPQRLHAVVHERPGDVVRVARVRRRQDTDLHVLLRRRANTAGAAIARRAMT